LRFNARFFQIAGVLVLLVGIGLAPRIAWYFARSRTLNVVVVDKTVPFRNYREHAVVAWLLRALKIRDGSGAFLDPATGYKGFDPASKTGHDLTDADLASADALVITDTYGVYRGDYEHPGDVAALERSPKIYGGLSDDEASAIAAFDARGGLVLAEFNTFASPTAPSAREHLEQLFGVRWTRWVARYWPDLQDPREVPRWVGAAYERAYGAPFDLTGAGLVFVHEDGDIVVLREKGDLEGDVITQERTPIGVEFGFPPRGTFWYWIDVVDAAGAEVLYEHVVHATEAGRQKLAAHGLPARFPAMTRHAGSGTGPGAGVGAAYYFAGDFADSGLELGSPERAWLLGYKETRTSAGCGGARDDSFFWGFYAPIVSRLLVSRAH
jgi:hypothetical protein